MALFLGYDPGGYSKGPRNAAVAFEINADGSFCWLSSKDKTRVRLFHRANEVICWFSRVGNQPRAVALGVDAPLRWSLASRRACDVALKSRYTEHSSSVAHQNSVMGALAINGVLVASSIRQSLGLKLVESHPKLVVKENLIPQRVKQQHDALANGKDDHAADAFIAAWCASRSYFGDSQWSTDLYRVDSDDPLVCPAGPATYPWPESVVPKDSDNSGKTPTVILADDERRTLPVSRG